MEELKHAGFVLLMIALSALTYGLAIETIGHSFIGGFIAGALASSVATLMFFYRYGKQL